VGATFTTGTTRTPVVDALVETNKGSRLRAERFGEAGAETNKGSWLRAERFGEAGAETNKGSWHSWVERVKGASPRLRWHLVWMGLWSLVGVVGTLASPALLDQPVALMALSPRTLFLPLAATALPLPAFVLLGTLRLGVTDASYFLVGRATVPAVRVTRSKWSMLGICQRLIQFMARSRGSAALILFLRPNSKYLAAAGSQKVSPLLAGAASVLGTVAWLVAVHTGITAVFEHF